MPGKMRESGDTDHRVIERVFCVSELCRDAMASSGAKSQGSYVAGREVVTRIDWERGWLEDLLNPFHLESLLLR